MMGKYFFTAGYLYRLFAHSGFFNLRGMYWDKKKETLAVRTVRPI